MAGKTVFISNQPYFYKKAELFPGSAFVIGADTAARLVLVCHSVLSEPSYHQNVSNNKRRNFIKHGSRLVRKTRWKTSNP